MDAAEVEGNHVPSIPLPDLPSEIIWFHILTRLPPKSLMRFKCVCKSWSSLITRRDPSFLTVYRNLHCNLNSTHMLLRVTDKRTRQQHFLSLQINQDGSPSPATATHLLTLQPLDYHYRINTECINGLVCFHFGNNHPIRIFNPCTRESITLPFTSPTHYRSASPIINHRSVDIGYCFGFSPLTNEYMVLQVHLCRFLHEEPPNFFRMVARVNLQVFTLGTDSWRCVEVDQDDLPFDPTVWRIDKKSVCLHGAIHWVHEEETCILVFDLGEEKFRVIPFPENDGSHHLYRTITDVGGCLAITYDKHTMRNFFGFGLWILKDYQNQVWVKEIIVFSYLVRQSTYPFSSLCAIHTGEVLIRSSPPAQASLQFYNMESESFRTSSIIFPEWICQNDACTRWDILYIYNETIAPFR